MLSLTQETFKQKEKQVWGQNEEFRVRQVVLEFLLYVQVHSAATSGLRVITWIHEHVGSHTKA